MFSPFPRSVALSQEQILSKPPQKKSAAAFII